jgi:hypothetical protein
MELKQYLVVGALSVSMLTGCGSDSDSAGSYGATYSGSTDAGVISEDTKSAFETSAVEMSKGLVASMSYYEFLYALPGGMGGPLAVESSANTVVNIAALNAVKELVLRLKAEVNTDLPIGIAVSEEIESECDSIQGNVVFTSVSTMSEDSQSYSMTVIFNDYCDDDNYSDIEGLFYNGKVTMEYTESETEDGESEGERMEFNNLSITFPEAEPETGVTSLLFNGFNESVETSIFEDSSYTDTYSSELTMTAGILSGSFSGERVCDSEGCTDTTEFTGLDGNTYRIDDSDSYNNNVDGKIYDATLGYVGMDGSSLSLCFDAEGSVHLDQGGEISLMDDAGTEMTIEVTACGVYESTIIIPVTSQEP